MGFERRCDTPELWEARRIITYARASLKRANPQSDLLLLASTDDDTIYGSDEFKRQFCAGREIDVVAARAYSERIAEVIQTANGDARGQTMIFPNDATPKVARGNLEGKAYERFHSILF